MNVSEAKKGQKVLYKGQVFTIKKIWNSKLWNKFMADLKELPVTVFLDDLKRLKENES